MSLHRLFSNGSARYRFPVAIAVYAVALLFSLWLSYEVRFDFSVQPPEKHQLILVGCWIIPLKLLLLLCIGQFAGLLSYFSIPDLRRLLLALATVSFFIACVWIATEGRWAPPRGVILADFFLSILALSAIRLALRMLREKHLVSAKPAVKRASRVGIIGAGDAGATLARELSSKTHLGLRPVVFFDDDPIKQNSRVHEIPVVGPPEHLLGKKQKWKLDKIIIAMPSAPGTRIRDIVTILQQAGLPFETVPSFDQLATGQLKVTQIRPVEIQDLLGREPVELHTADIRQILESQTVMVTGAGGSIGSELCRQIAGFRPKRLLLVEQCEVQLFKIEQELIHSGYGKLIVPLIADILDLPRMRYIFDRYQPQAVFHAAAHKHVPMMENHPCEAIKNNTLGTVRVATLALEYGVSRFVLISSDKAIRPTSVMGATKRFAEIYIQSLSSHQSQLAGRSDQSQVLEFGFATKPHRRNGSQTQFMAVRFGNVLGSSGSVVPIFKEQIAAGGPVTVTHPDVTRYFMIIPEAVGLVLQSASQGKGGEIFVLDMGEPIKILDLARNVIELSGFRPGVDIEIEFTGLRPGEKLFEELSYEGENLLRTHHPKILRLGSTPVPFEQVERQLQQLEAKLNLAEPSELKVLLENFLPEYRPDLRTCEPAGAGKFIAPKDEPSLRQPVLVP